jgi:hypothetical protein
VSFASRPRDTVVLAGKAGATVTRPCPWCKSPVRPCNTQRHIASHHHKQLTIYDVLGGGRR